MNTELTALSSLLATPALTGGSSLADKKKPEIASLLAPRTPAKLADFSPESLFVPTQFLDGDQLPRNLGDLNKLSDEPADAFQFLEKNFATYDVDGNGHLTEDEIKTALAGKFTDDLIKSLVDDLNILQAANGNTNNADGESGANSYRNLTPNDLSYIRQQLESGKSLDDIQNDTRARQITDDYYIASNDAELEQQVTALAENLDVTITDGTIPEGGDDVSRGEYEASLAQKKVIARQLLELYGNNPEVIGETIVDQRLHFVISTADNGVVGGAAFSRDGGVLGIGGHDGYVYLDQKTLETGLADPSDGYEVITHEFSHAVDSANTNNITGDKRYQEIRDSLFEQYNEEFEGPSPPLGDQFWRQESVVPGLKNYAFYSEEEFFAVTLALFREEPEKLKESIPALYAFYVEKLGLPTAG